MAARATRAAQFRFTLASFSLLTVLAAVSGATTSEPAVAAQGAVPLDQEKSGDPAVRSLVAEYDLDTRRAQLQMETQIAAGRAEADLPPRLLEVYAGRSIDHTDGANVTVGVIDETAASEMRNHFMRHGVPDIGIRSVTMSQSMLIDTIATIANQLRASRADGSEPLIGIGLTELGLITIRIAPGELNETEQTVVQAARVRPELYKIQEVEEIETGQPESCDFTEDIECDPPLRGSVRITGGGLICTAGFIARSRSDDRPYVLTAGHCDDKTPTSWSTQFADESSHIIGPFHNSDSSSTIDAGILRVVNPDGWSFGWPLVTVDPSGGQTQNENYIIERTFRASLHDRVCATLGNSARTDCGEVTDTYVGEGYPMGLFQVSNLCTGGGDSGSPYFAYNAAHGIHSVGDAVSGTSGCKWGRAERAIEAAQAMNVYIVTA